MIEIRQCFCFVVILFSIDVHHVDIYSCVNSRNKLTNHMKKSRYFTQQEKPSIDDNIPSARFASLTYRPCVNFSSKTTNRYELRSVLCFRNYPMPLFDFLESYLWGIPSSTFIFELLKSFTKSTHITKLLPNSLKEQ